MDARFRSSHSKDGARTRRFDRCGTSGGVGTCVGVAEQLLRRAADDLTLFDPGGEKVDLAFRLAQTVFTCAKAEHALAVTDSLDELAGDFTRVVYCANARSARMVNRWAGVEATCTDGASIEQAVAYLHAHLMSTASKEGTPLVLSLLPSEVLLPGLKHSRIDWPKAWIDDHDGRYSAPGA